MKEKKLSGLAAVVLLTILSIQFSVAQSHNQLSQKEKAEGWQLLFNGTDFTGWRGVNKDVFPAKGWAVKNNTITCTGEDGGSIITKEKFGDFELSWQWKMVSPAANSGIKYFVAEREGDTGGYGYGIEYQLLDDPEYIKSGQMKTNDFHTTGAAYELYPPSPDKKTKKPGAWNSSRIVSKNGKVEHWLNGEKVLEYDRFSGNFKEKVAASKFKDVTNFGQHTKGHILLQDHDSEIYFRNIKLKKL
ncbi:3-keto-disaccharide hydrolase [Maribellus maritimus]|uniref:3-keto-disaccharide hydrolase n=1 Tax=Maribellus maritimus TaxID=2870838 RepID=UPI001EEA1A43|nr:DUF1080 domain-containing protein [Maribellus maritimus]MCG6185941.1 DUF1080 domain-containing protein [Maribellus maritimus]